MSSAAPLTCLGGSVFLGTLAEAKEGFDNVLAVCEGTVSTRACWRCVEISDESTSLLLPHFDQALQFLHKSVASEATEATAGKKTLICCRHGQSRSLAVATAALMVALKDEARDDTSMLVKDLLALMKEERPSMHINPGFVAQLMIAAEMLLSRPASTRHALAAARARLAVQAYGRAARGAICNGIDLIDPIAPDSEVKERPSCWIAGVCGRDIDPLFRDERWENIRAVPPAAAGKGPSARVFRPDTFKRLAETKKEDLPSVSRFLGDSKAGIAAEVAEPRLWLSCANCRGKLASDRNLVDIPLSVLRQLQEDASAELPPGSRPARPEAATLTAPATESPYFFVEIMDWCLPSFVFPGASSAEASGASIPRPVAATRAKTFLPKIASATDDSDSSEPETAFSDFEAEGKLRCPCCGIKVGRFDWQGAWNGGEAFKEGDSDPSRILAQAVYECRNYNFISPAFALLKEAVRLVPAGGLVAPSIAVVGGRAAAAMMAAGGGGGGGGGAGAGGADSAAPRGLRAGSVVSAASLLKR